jgi:hypothetical protein
MKERIHTTVDEIFSAVQKLTEACLCVTAVGACYGINQLFYYWPIVQANG